MPSETGASKAAAKGPPSGPAGAPAKTSPTGVAGLSTFGRYLILDRIAVGGMAELFLARSASMGGVDRTCVIKRILPQFSSDLTFVNMFIDEARITVRLEHKNIVQLYDFGQVDGTYFMAMEYVDGTDLAALMRAHLQLGRPLPPPLAAFVARELLLGLAHAHGMPDHNGKPLGIVHRDVSPQNVLLSANGDVKLTDFGIAAARHKLTLTSPGTVLGKAAYMSPEQATGKPVDASTDVWAVGVILHEMLSGERLFSDETPVLTAQRVVHEAVVPPSSKVRTVPPALDWVVLRALERRTTQRYPSAQAMADELTAFLNTQLIGDQPYGSTDLARALLALEWTDDTSRMRPTHKARGSDERTFAGLPPLVSDRELDRLVQELRERPSYWGLVAIGERYGRLSHSAAALSAYRTASALFAYRGLMVQALCAYHGCRRLLTPPEVQADLMVIGDLSPGSQPELTEALRRFDQHRIAALMEALEGQLEPSPAPVPITPLFGALGPSELAKLGALLRVRRVGPGDVVIREGERGDALFAVGRGQFVVYCRPGAVGEGANTRFDRQRNTASVPQHKPSSDDRVYLAGLADGDFFGEFSFLTERPRSATVEAVSDGVLLEIRRDDVQGLFEADPSFTLPLLQFYKDRVMELMLAKSPGFSLLGPDERRLLLSEAAVAEYKDQAIIVQEGSAKDAFFFIKRGEVEVLRVDHDGTSIFINKLGEGDFFGEIAALLGSPRTVSVRAMGDASVFEIPRRSLVDIMDRQPKLRELLEATIAQRTADTANRLDEYRRVFFGT